MSCYHTPRLVRSGITREGIPFRVYESQLTGKMLIAYDFELLRRYEEDHTRVHLRCYREPIHKHGWHKRSRDD